MPRGQIAAVIGPNGCGKSTLLAMLAGVLRPDEGSVLCALPPRQIGYVAQGDCLFEELSVTDNLMFWGAAAGLTAKAAARSPFAGLLGLDEFAKKRVSRLSGGMRRRVALCTALLGDPGLLLLDEPFTGLDMIYKQELASCLLELRAKGGKTILYTTHSADELGSLSDVTLLLANGRLIWSRETRALLGQGNLQDILTPYIRGAKTHE